VGLSVEPCVPTSVVYRISAILNSPLHEPFSEVGTPAELETWYRSMLRIRLFEDEVQSLFLQGHVPGTTHLCNGQEAISVGVCDVLAPQDVLFNTYRGHGWALALGVSPAALLGELMGRATGSCGGRASAMNMFDLAHQLYGTYAIVGGGIGAGTGSALASQIKGDDVVTIAVFGDGAVNQAYFHECLNLASIRSLPIVYVCENNLYAEYTSMYDSTAGHDLAARARAYAVPARKVDGNDILEVRREAHEAITSARHGEGPVFLEFLTYRQKGHSRTDDGLYRPAEELEEWLAKDPISRLAGNLTPDRVSVIRDETYQEIVTARDGALEAPFPDISTLELEDAEFKWRS
jgi:TPP-dependent pyruvate/acetoin dehydrogenase alpha subunit